MKYWKGTLYISVLIVQTYGKRKSWGQSESSERNLKVWKKTYPNMRSIHSCKWADTYSLSRAILCLCTKSTGFSAQAGSFTVSGNVKINDNKSYNMHVNIKQCLLKNLLAENLNEHTKLFSQLCCPKINWIFICEDLREVK